MKHLYLTNKWLLIINAVLFIIPYFGLLFLIILGIIQLIMCVVVIGKFNMLNKSGKTQLIVYSIITSSILILTMLSYNDDLYFNDTLFIFVIITSILLALLHLNITYLLYKNSQDEIN
ncbi:hypothetical protein QLS71_010100 [Mariniflexile litorale]|uniref:Uncharacterized protein n=1 Tax=Mariniflexile litorale TaxID=3045158 RepID=A0AAU7EAW4_9FLAO|nr:hypothetical protein [Mariniflexile sp. KMM 9835]MDQ8213421.1 hypothetical protein [Mariniflexile sp. KMM 9835]